MFQKKVGWSYWGPVLYGNLMVKISVAGNSVSVVDVASKYYCYFLSGKSGTLDDLDFFFLEQQLSSWGAGGSSSSLHTLLLLSNNCFENLTGLFCSCGLYLLFWFWSNGRCWGGRGQLFLSPHLATAAK